MSESAELIDLEHRRCRAELRGDWSVLSDLLDVQFVYVAGSGAVLDKKTLLEERRYLEWLLLERQDLNVRVSGDIAVITGSLLFRTRQSGAAEIASGKAFCTQVLSRCDGQWRFVLQQLTRLP